MLFLIFILFYIKSVIATFGNDTVCYNELGCFDNNYPWFQILRPFPMPDSPQEVNTTFYFSNRETNKSYVETWPNIKMNVQFNASKPTYFITHGYSSDTNNNWFKNLTEAILYQKDANLFSVDWSKGSSGFYFSASSNTRIVAAEISRVIRYLMINNAADISKFHLMGHSLGSHVMSYVGKNISGINRITAMDPAQPGFQGRNSKIRLDDTDANFIDVLHTDGKPFLPFLGFGITKSVGTVDFYLNGGLFQPNCVLDGENFMYKSFYDVPNITLAILYNLATCSHSRAPRYMAAAIRENCNMWGYRYDAESSNLRYEKFIIKDSCNADTCSKIGLDTDEYPATGNFAMMTSGIYPFCLNDTDANNKMSRVLTTKKQQLN